MNDPKQMTEIKIKDNQEVNNQAIEKAMISNDLSGLNTEQRLMFYKKICQSLGINYLTQPFGYILLNGKLTLYAKKDATDQLRSLKKVSLTIVSREKVEGCYVVTARAMDATGRTDESIGAVPLVEFGKPLQADKLANALMKAETKAKRRVTLSICGLGFVDESEIETIQGAKVISQAELEKREKNPEEKGAFESAPVSVPPMKADDVPFEVESPFVHYIVPTGPDKDKRLFDLPETNVINLRTYCSVAMQRHGLTEQQKAKINECLEAIQFYMETKSK